MRSGRMTGLRQALSRVGERRLVWLEGSEAETQAAAQAWLSGDIFWLGEGPSQYAPLPAAKALQRLGQECDTLVFNSFSGFHPDAFGALAGTLRAGGLLILLTPPRAEWPAFADPDRLRLVSTPDELPRAGQGFIARLARLLPEDPALDLALPSGSSPWQPIRADRPMTAGQANAIQAVRQVLQGHRRRPLVISADRGRGKSAALGLAAATLLREQSGLRIAVTAPAKATVASLLEHAGSAGQTLDGIGFYSPQQLIQEEISCDLLLVDEAAAIPTPLLEAMLARHSRIVFATTEHGYEGTGRGFHLRFKAHLDGHAPGWRELHLDEPVRWRAGCPLEALVFRLLGLAAEVSAPLPALAPVRRQITQQALASDEALLNQVFGLLVLAHYQTTPSDLRILLESPDLDIHLLEQESGLLGVALVAREGHIPAELAEEIWAGRRRPRGHLLPQSLLAHAGLREAGDRSYGRVLRIAVHPELHRRGLGSLLLDQLVSHYRESGFDYLGAAFSATADLLPFWRRAGLQALRIGLQRDAASGSHAALLLRALRPEREAELARWHERFCRQLPTLLAGELRELDPELVWQCVAPVEGKEGEKGEPTDRWPGWEAFDGDELTCFAHHHKPFELCQPSLQRWLAAHLNRLHGLQSAERALLIASIWQYAPWEGLARRQRLSGKPALIKALRGLLARLL
ncbi:tRNA(Met) cytidine acetyltransferase TmcA [Aeromonas sp. BIGb0445]|uniref:tRNA(Met) cytidine acetyltransferase TmcA n=1 Tax=Aeromonas sp. BIGb0445 TaxID=2940593 RepID=UPI0038577DC0